MNQIFLLAGHLPPPLVALRKKSPQGDEEITLSLG